MGSPNYVGITREAKDIPGSKSYYYVYCHWGADLDDNGRMLYDNYKTTEDVNNLLQHGGMSQVAKTPQECRYYKFWQNKEDVGSVRVNDNGRAMRADSNDTCYLWTGSKWIFSPKDEPYWFDLAQVFEDEDENRRNEMNREKALAQFGVTTNLSLDGQRSCMYALTIDYFEKMAYVIDPTPTGEGLDYIEATVKRMSYFGIDLDGEDIKNVTWFGEVMNVEPPFVWTVPYVEALCFLLCEYGYRSTAKRLIAVTNEFVTPEGLYDADDVTVKDELSDSESDTEEVDDKPKNSWDLTPEELEANKALAAQLKADCD